MPNDRTVLDEYNRFWNWYVVIVTIILLLLGYSFFRAYEHGVFKHEVNTSCSQPVAR